MLAEQVNVTGPISAPAPRASPLFLREPEIRRGVELLYFGYSHMTRSADTLLALHDLGRAHQRALYFIARQPGLTVGELLRLLAITKQSLSRVLNELITRDLVAAVPGENDRRQKLLRLTGAGTTLETELFDRLRERLSAAYGRAGQEAVTGFWQVLEGLIPPEDRALVMELCRSA
jgi:DNA-binding MarR family transcriptional regulator